MTAFCSPISIRGAARPASSTNAPQPLPEGTTFAGDDVREFQAGAFIAVAREKGAVTPVGVAYETRDAIYGDEPVGDHMKRIARAPAIRVAVAVGTPFSAAGAGVRSLAERARSEVQALVRRARGVVGGSP